MARTIDAELRDDLERGYKLCVEVPTQNEDCRGWLSITAVLEDEAIKQYRVNHFDFRNRWLETEYDPSGDEYPVDETFKFHTEVELNHFLDKVVPKDGHLARAMDVADFPG